MINKPPTHEQRNALERSVEKKLLAMVDGIYQF